MPHSKTVLALALFGALAGTFAASAAQAQTWTNVWAYTSIPSVREIVVLRSDRVAASLLRRLPDGMWPERPDEIGDGTLALESIGFSVRLMELYVTTQLYRSSHTDSR